MKDENIRAEEHSDDEFDEADWLEYDWQEDERYIRSSTAGDYGPGNPWDAPGMCISDFI